MIGLTIPSASDVHVALRIPASVWPMLIDNCSVASPDRFEATVSISDRCRVGLRLTQKLGVGIGIIELKRPRSTILRGISKTQQSAGRYGYAIYPGHTLARGTMEMKLITNLICWGQLTKLPVARVTANDDSDRSILINVATHRQARRGQTKAIHSSNY